jgi:hypothetical protein
MSEKEIATIAAWVDDDTPEGNPSDAPSPRQFTDGWQLGEPDVVLEPDESFAIPAEGPDVYRCFVFPTRYGEDRYVAAMEVRAGNRAVVHHAMGYIDTTGTARRLDAAAPGPGYTAFGGVGFAAAGTLDGWGPGVAPHRLPDGVGMALPKGADIVVQLHYHPTGKPEQDRTRIGLHFCKTPVEKRLNMAVALNLNLRIVAGAKSHEERATLAIPQDITLLRIAPHMHLLGKEMTVTVTLPDGTSRKLVRVPDWDFRWQSIFTFNEPVRLPKGSRVEVVGRFDNSASNPANPAHPPRDVKWGEGTNDEMCVAALFYTVDAEHLTRGVAVDAFAPPPGSGGKPRQLDMRERLALGVFDKNGDGKLDAAERESAMKFIAAHQGHELSPDERKGAEQFLDTIGGKRDGGDRH